VCFCRASGEEERVWGDGGWWGGGEVGGAVALCGVLVVFLFFA
jgi:hypothetical protein